MDDLGLPWEPPGYTGTYKQVVATTDASNADM